MAVKPSYAQLEKQVQALEEQVLMLRKQVAADRDRPDSRLGDGADLPGRERYKRLVNAMKDWVWSMDVSGRHTFSNRAVESLLGYKMDEIIGRPVLLLVHPDSRPVAEAVIAQSVRQERGWTGLGLKWVHRDGSVRYFESTASPDYDGLGRLIGFSGIDRDVTGRKAAEQALRESEDRMRSIFRAAPTGIGLVSERRILRVNQRMCEMTGYESRELVGQNARILYPAEADYEFVGREKYRQIKARGTGTVETRFRCRDGRIIDVLMSSTPIDPSDWSKGVTFTALPRM